MALLHFGVILVVISSLTNELDQMQTGGALSGASLYIFGLLGVLIAVRQKGIWLWVTYILSALLFGATTVHFTLGYLLAGNTLLSFMLVVMMVLSIGRLIEYVYIRYIVGLQDPIMTVGAWVVYTAVALICFVLTSPSLGEWITCSTSNCQPLPVTNQELQRNN